MHPNTRRLVIVLAVIAALLIGVNIGRNLPGSQSLITPTPTIAPTATPKPITQRTYTSKTCGVTFNVPSNLTTNESSESVVQFTDPKHPENTVTLICQQGIPRVPLPANKIESFVIPSVSSAATASAKLYHDMSAKDGTQIDKLIFTNRKTGLDVYIAGFGDVYTGIIASLKLL